MSCQGVCTVRKMILQISGGQIRFRGNSLRGVSALCVVSGPTTEGETTAPGGCIKWWLTLLLMLLLKWSLNRFVLSLIFVDRLLIRLAVLRASMVKPSALWNTCCWSIAGTPRKLKVIEEEEETPEGFNRSLAVCVCYFCSCEFLVCSCPSSAAAACLCPSNFKLT